MKIAAVCVTYKRPTQLSRLIGCFLEQDHPDRELVILDDAGQYDDQEGDGWRLVSRVERYPTLGAKRNAAMRLASPDADGFAIWDDDDCYLPGALSACAAGLERAPWVRPSLILIAHEGRLRQYRTHQDGAPARKLFHAAWAMSRGLIDELGGYGGVNCGEDQHLLGRLLLAKTPDADPIELGFNPYAVIWWDREQTQGEAPKLSWLGGNPWRYVGDLPAERVPGPITPRLPDHFDYCEPIIEPEIHGRPF